MESRDALARWLPWCHPAYSIADTEAWVRRQVAAFQTGEEYAFLISDETNRILGTCGLNHLDHADRCANIGYWVRSSCIGKGLATLATRKLVDWVFQNTDFIRLEILASVRNASSQRVAEKAGAHREGVLRSRIVLADGSHDCAVFSFVRERPANQALLPTSMSVTDRACARSAPDTLAADL